MFQKIKNSITAVVLIILTVTGLSSWANNDLRDCGDPLLIVGCRPWDKNIEEVTGLENAEFLDFMNHYAPEKVPEAFHHLDINDNGTFDAGKMSCFAATNSGRFNLILIDWATYQHVRRDTAWNDFATLLKNGGKLVVPVGSKNLITGEFLSGQKADELKTKLLNVKEFGEINLFKHHEMPAMPTDLLTYDRKEGQESLLKTMLRLEPIVVFATRNL